MASVPFSLTNPIVDAIAALYGVGTSVNAFIDEHIEVMKRSSNATVRATGNVIEGAKYGFGIGYITPLVVIAVGQLILGNPLSSIAVIGSGVMLTNPTAMTCGALGAIYYGWKALSEDERNAIIDRLTVAFTVGSELILAIVQFVVRAMGELLSAENIEEFKRFVAETARSFGRSLSDVTHSMKDRISDAADVVSMRIVETAEAVIAGASTAADAVASSVSSAAEVVKESADGAVGYVKRLSNHE
jgi:hypothetical protein